MTICMRLMRSALKKWSFSCELDESRTGITEKLKVHDQMKWVRLMNNVRNVVEEIVLKKFVYA